MKKKKVCSFIENIYGVDFIFFSLYSLTLEKK